MSSFFFLLFSPLTLIDMEEIYKDVIGYEGLYEVSNQGNVKSLKRNKILSPGIVNGGYFTVVLCKNGEVKHYRVHRLVAEAFIPNPARLPEINHINKDKTDNRAENLEWCDRQYNIDYSLSKQVAQYDFSGNLINVWKSVNEIQRQLGFSSSHISHCCLGKYKTMYGYVWRYV